MSTAPETSSERAIGAHGAPFAQARSLLARVAIPYSPWSLAAARRALVGTVLCFAAMHVVIRIADGAMRGNLDLLNLFTLIEAQRLWPALAVDPNARGWSLALGLCVFFALFWSATLARSAVPVRVTAQPWPATMQKRTTSAARSAPVPVRLTAAQGALALVAGLTLHMGSLTWIGALVDEFPPVPDVLHTQLPYVNFGAPGELVYFAFMLTMGVVLFRTQPRTVPAILVALGLFYGIRGIFLFLLPIGIPPTSPPLSERFVFWPFAEHAFFPGGHTGMMTVLSLSIVSTPWRRAFLAVTLAFALGTLLNRAHYTADAFGGWLVGYAVTLWARQHLGPLAGAMPVDRDAVLAPTVHKKVEA